MELHLLLDATAVVAQGVAVAVQGVVVAVQGVVRYQHFAHH